MPEALDIVIYVLLFLAVVFGFILGFFVQKRTGSTVKKIDGYLNVSAENAHQIYQLEIATEPEDLAKQNHMVLKIRKINTDPPHDDN